jgi:hypothetical protein
MFKVTNELIKSLNPCKARHDNYLKFYTNKEYSKAQFLGLKNISHSDKLWVAFRLMPKDNIRLACADIAESVLHIFEAKYPDDKRPRLAIEAARRGNAVAAYAANTAAAAANAAAAYAANANAYAAAYAAYAAAYAANAAAANAAYAYAADAAYAYAADAAANAAYAAAAAAAADAAYAAAYAGLDKAKQEKLIRTIVLKYWR